MERESMAGYIGVLQQAQDGKSYGFTIYDETHRACVYLRFSTWDEAEKAARDAQSLLATALACVRR
jgi:hypothetical protein